MRGLRGKERRERGYASGRRLPGRPRMAVANAQRGKRAGKGVVGLSCVKLRRTDESAGRSGARSPAACVTE